MHKKLEFWGVVGTAIYLLVIASTVAFKFSDFVALELNELGDFLAGAFGPIAFLWLVLGFLQQGRELKLSSDALRLQADELRNSVAQQTIMAQAAMLQIESQRAALKIQQEELERSFSPLLRFQHGGRSGGSVGGEVSTSLQLFNDGPEVRELSIRFEPSIGNIANFSVGTLKHGGSSSPVPFRFIWPSEDVRGACVVDYLRSDGKRNTEEFTYVISAVSPFVRVEKNFSTVTG